MALAPRFDHILLDTGAGISDVVLYAVSLADEVLVVATPEPTSLTDAYATIKVLATTQGRRKFNLLVNQTRKMGEGRAVRHFDVEEQEVDRIVAQKSLSQHRIVKAGQQLKTTQFGQVFAQNLPRDGFVLNDYTANFFHCLSSNTTIKTSSSSSISKRCWAGYRSSGRRRTFSRPSPAALLGLVEAPILFSTTHFS